MRIALTALLLTLLASVALPQTGGNLFATTKPDVSIVVRKLATGADSVEVSMIEANYPPEVLQQQINRVGEVLGVSPSAVRIERNEIDKKANLVYLQGLFTVPGLVDVATGTLRVEPFAKAFAGGSPEHLIDVLMIRFDGVAPGPNTLRLYNPADNTVKVQAVGLTNPIGVEYRVQLLTQDPAKINIPDAKKTEASKPDPPHSNAPGTDPILMGSIVAAALAAGALVYSLLLRAKPQNRGSKRA